MADDTGTTSPDKTVRRSPARWGHGVRFAAGVCRFALDAAWQVGRDEWRGVPRHGTVSPLARAGSTKDGAMSLELAEAPTETVESPQAGALMVRQAYKLVVDLMKPKPWVYWTDLMLSAAIGWASLLVGANAHGWLAAGCFVVSALALYRASLFIHELTHLKAGSVPNFEAGWNAVIGVPLLLPSFFYVGVHHLHHARSRYGTAEDPEYLPLAHRSPFNLVVFLIAAALLPVALIGRFLLLSPISLLHKSLRELTVTRASALAINPAFRRRWPTGQDLVNFHRQEIACTIWAFVLAGLLITHVIPWHGFFFAVGVASAVGFVNQIRTAVAHLFENEGEEMTIEQQLLDSVNVPGNPIITTLWAPVGLRFHALHHLLPGLPYHSLGAAHRRLLAELPSDSPYRKTIVSGLWPTLVQLFRSSARSGSATPIPASSR
ncbi:MAG: fatty acid desaturase [Gemmatimonadota bacterium]